MIYPCADQRKRCDKKKDSGRGLCLKSSGRKMNRFCRLNLAFSPPRQHVHEILAVCLHLNNKENEDKIHAMKTAETTLLATAEESKARIADLERQVRGLRETLEGREAEGAKLGLRLDQALQDLEKSREENAKRSAKEQVRIIAGRNYFCLVFSRCCRYVLGYVSWCTYLGRS